MSLFARYMARRFFAPFLFSLGLFSVLIFLGDSLDRMHLLAKSHATLGEMLRYLWLRVPYWAVRTIPMATLLATLMALIGFVQSGEWIAAQAAGFKTSAFWIPLLGCSAIVAALSFAAQETILPACYRRSQQLWQDRIHPEWEWDKFFDIALIGGPDEFISAKVFLPKEGLMDRPLFERVGPDGALESQLDARRAVWDPQARRWVFEHGVERRFSQGRVESQDFDRRASPLAVPPRLLIPRARKPDEMSLGELRRYAEQLRHLGVSPRAIEVGFHGKLAAPFTNIVICALGIPIALRLRRCSKPVSFSIALMVSMAFVFVSEIGLALGEAGRVSAPVAAWMANATFGVLGAALLRGWAR